MFHGAAKHSTETLQCSTQPLNIAWKLSNVPWRCYILHRDPQIFHGAPKNFVETLKCSKGRLKIQHRLSNVLRRP